MPLASIEAPLASMVAPLPSMAGALPSPGIAPEPETNLLLT